jgi:hypothetical protein
MLCLIGRWRFPSRARVRVAAFPRPTTLFMTSSPFLGRNQPYLTKSDVTTITNTNAPMRINDTASHVRRCYSIERRLETWHPSNLTSG